MEKHQNDEKRVTPREKAYADFGASPLPVNPENGEMLPAGPINPPEAAPPSTPEHSWCHRDCRHYWNLQTLAPDGKWKNSKLRQHHHTCLVNPGMETDLGDDNVFFCSQWDPYTKQELVQLGNRRDAYSKRNEPKISWWRRLFTRSEKSK